jgi:hypothetical protein
MSFGRIDNNKKIELIPQLINSAAKNAIAHQERYYHPTRNYNVI